MTSISARFFEVFKNLKSDAVPKPAREKYKPGKVTIDDVTDEENDENVDVSNDQDDIEIELEDFSTGRSKPHKNGKPKSKKPKKDEPSNYVSVQAGGSVCNIVNASNIHVGNVNVYNLGMPCAKGSQTASNSSNSDPNASIKKDAPIALVMEAEIKVTHEYIHYVAKNLGTDWKIFFMSLDYSDGLIDTMLMENHQSITETRYKLLLDWARNDEKGTLGRLATLLWEEGQRQIVKFLADMYKKNLQKKNTRKNIQ